MQAGFCRDIKRHQPCDCTRAATKGRCLPAARTLTLPVASRDTLARVLKDFRAACATRADAAWLARRSGDAVLWKAAGVYAGHIRRAVLAIAPADDVCSEAVSRPTWSAGRFARRQAVNPLLALASSAGLPVLDTSARCALAVLLEQLAAHNRERAAVDWARHKAPVAAYELHVAMYAAHLARAARAPHRFFPSGEAA
jgi:hypothetical protein